MLHVEQLQILQLFDTLPAPDANYGCPAATPGTRRRGKRQKRRARPTRDHAGAVTENAKDGDRAQRDRPDIGTPKTAGAADS